MNRPIPSADGSHVLRPGRAYRLLLVVNGASSIEDLAETFFQSGFSPDGFAISGPKRWPEDRPPDWPDEPTVAIAANECHVRVSGPFVGSEDGRPIRFDPDLPIVGGQALYSIVALWECRRDLRSSPTRSGGAPPSAAVGVALPAEEKSKPPIGMLVTAGTLFAIGFWQHRRSEQRFARETRRMRQLIGDQDRERLDARVRALLGEGLDRRAAEEVAIREELTPELAALAAVERADQGEPLTRAEEV